MDIVTIAAVAFTLAGFVKGVVGFGFPVITLIILTFTIGLLDALAIIVMPTIVTNVWQGLSGPYLKDIAKRMWLYFAVAIAFIRFTSGYLTVITIKWPTAMLGAALRIFALSRLLHVSLSVPREWELPLSIPLALLTGVPPAAPGLRWWPFLLCMSARVVQS